MDIVVKNAFGLVSVNRKVIEKIVEKTVSQCYGVLGLSIFSKNSVTRMFKHSAGKKGIIINRENKGIEIAISVAMCYGVKASAVIKNVKENVKYKVESLIGIDVVDIDVVINKVGTEA